MKHALGVIIESSLEERMRQFCVVARCGIKHKRKNGVSLLGIARGEFGLSRAQYFVAYSRAVADLAMIDRLDMLRRFPKTAK